MCLSLFSQSRERFFSLGLCLGVERCRYLPGKPVGGDWVARITTALPGESRLAPRVFWSLDFLIFYAYYIVCVGLLHCSGLSTAHTVGNTGQYSVLH